MQRAGWNRPLAGITDLILCFRMRLLITMPRTLVSNPARGQETMQMPPVGVR